MAKAKASSAPGDDDLDEGLDDGASVPADDDAGGVAGGGPDDTFRWNGTSWTLLAPLPVTNFSFATDAMATDVVRGRLRK